MHGDKIMKHIKTFGLCFFSFLTFWYIYKLMKQIESKRLPLVPPEDQMKKDFCSSSLKTDMPIFHSEKPILYIITPTYTRREQIIELTRLSHTLSHINNVLWIIAEDSEICSDLLNDLLQRFSD